MDCSSRLIILPSYGRIDLSVACWLAVGPLSADSLPTVGRQSVWGAIVQNYPMFYLLSFVLSFVIKRDFAHNHRFLLQKKHKATDKTLEQCFLKELKATYKTSSESELKQQKAI